MQIDGEYDLSCRVVKKKHSTDLHIPIGYCIHAIPINMVLARKIYDALDEYLKDNPNPFLEQLIEDCKDPAFLEALRPTIKKFLDVVENKSGEDV